MESRIVLKAFTIGPVRRLPAGIELSIELGLGVGYKRGNLKVGRGVSIWFVGVGCKRLQPQGGTGITEEVKGFTAKFAERRKGCGERKKTNVFSFAQDDRL